MPITTQLLDEYAAWSPTAIYASENGKTYGKPPQFAEVFDVPARYFPMAEHGKKSKEAPAQIVAGRIHMKGAT